ncbi:SGM_5486 family transporter-associated protein [Streptomyces thermoalcalitolerans]
MQPVLDPNPKDGQKKLLLVCSAFLAIFVIIAVVATLAAP